MENFNFDKIKNIYVAGIGGIGVSAIAKFMLKNNKKVIGSELVYSEIVEQFEKMGVKINIGQKYENIKKNIDLLIYSPALPKNHPERKAARDFKIPELSYSEVLGLLTKKYHTIAISGTHGKSSTTAMIGCIFETAKKDPNVIVGSKLKAWDGNLRLGSSDILIAEACEWKAHFLEMMPKTIVINNLELDHPDCYKDEHSMLKTFQKFTNKLKKDDLLILNNDSKLLKQIKIKSKAFSFAIKNKADLMAKNIETNQKTKLLSFDLFLYGKFIDKITLTLPGEINVYNALASIAVALNYNVNIKDIKKALLKFEGIWRRFDRIGYFEFKKDKKQYYKIKNISKFEFKDNRSLVVSDYGHHPTAIEETLKATKDLYKKCRIVLAFQPHEHTRTKVLLAKYAKCFTLADVLILEEIYTVFGRESKKEIAMISSIDVIKKIEKVNKKTKTFFAKNNNGVLELISKNIKPKDIILIMGAGEIYNATKKLEN